MGSGFSKMKKQAKLMQQQMGQIKNDLANKTITGQAGNGLVTLTLSGDKELKQIAIKPECASDIEGLQDLIVAAFQDAASKLSQETPAQFPFF